MARAGELTWKKPGAGQWKWDGAHLPGAPTPLFQGYFFPSMDTGLGTMFERYGVPLRTLSFRLVNNKVYSRLLPLIGAEKEAKPPPAPVLWLVLRLHPTFRKRARNAAAAMTKKIWRAELAHWHDSVRQQWVQANLALQAEDLGVLDEAALADHLRRAFTHVGEGHRVHFELHGADLVPLGDLIAQCDGWGIEAADALALLEGASPATTEAARTLSPLGALVAAAPTPPTSLAEVRALGDEATAALDAYLRHYGWHMVTGYDVDCRTLGELPQVVLASIRSAATPRPPARPDADLAARLRARVPAEERTLFDELLTEARTVYGLRDDNGPLTAEWPLGLLRRAVLETGRRLAARGSVADPEQAVELTIGELTDALTTGSGPSADEVKARAARRAELAAIRPPALLGEDEPPPPLSVFPNALARTVRIAMAATGSIEVKGQREPLAGLGIGDAAYVGRARVADNPEDVLQTMVPGDVLVVRFTCPAFNTVLMAAGAVVTEEGGPLSHAAIMARELGIPGVIGAEGAMSRIKDGDRVEVDPRAGRVRVLK